MHGGGCGCDIWPGLVAQAGLAGLGGVRWTEVVAQSGDSVTLGSGGFPEQVGGEQTNSHFAKAVQQAGPCRVP